MKSIQLMYNIMTVIIILYAILHSKYFPLYTPDGIHYMFFMLIVNLIMLPLVIGMFFYDKKIFIGALIGLIIYNIGFNQKPNYSSIIIIVTGVLSLYFFNKGVSH